MFTLKQFKKKRALAATISALMMGSLILPGIPVHAVTDESVNIQILATSDNHGRFYPYDYAQNKEDKTGSLTQIATAVKSFRGTNPNTIVVDAGDTIQENSAQIFFDSNPDYKASGLIGHPMIKAFQEIGYDAVTLGNHEFNQGVPKLKQAYSPINNDNTVLSSNVYEKDGTTRMYSNYKIVDRGGVKVALLGITTPNIVHWDAENLNGYKVTNPIDEAKAAIKEIKDSNKADVIVAVVHMSESDEYENYGSGVENLLKEVQGLDFVVAGHGHKMVDDIIPNNDNKVSKNNVYSGVKMIENNARSKTIGKVDITVKKVDGKYKVVDKVNDVKAKLYEIYDGTAKKVNYEPDQKLMNDLKPYHEFALKDANIVIGKLEGGALAPENEIKEIPQAQLEPTAMMQFINEVQMHYTGADVSGAAMFKADQNIKAGDVKKADSSLIYTYENTLYKLEVTGAQLKKYMEWSVSYYNQYKQGDLTVSFNPDVRLYNYDMFNGVNYDIDISKPAGERIKNLTKANGAEIKDTDKLILAVNNYRANTQLLTYGPIFKQGEALPKLIEKDVKGDIGGVRELIGEYIKNVKGGIIKNDCTSNWKIVGNNWDSELRKLAVEKIKAGKIAIPRSVDGRSVNVASITEADLNKKIPLLSINDIHGAIPENGKNVGLAKLTTVFKDYKNKNSDTILLSGGDNYQGSALSNLLTGKPMNEFFKANGFEASAVGNHEFDWGLSTKDGSSIFAEWSKDSGMDFLAANITEKGKTAVVSWAKPYKMIEKDGVKIGVIGITTPDTLYQTKAENVKNIEFKDPVETTNYWADKLKNEGVSEGKADAVVVLSHLGTFQDKTTKEITGEGAELAKKAKNVDAVITAHSHQEVEGKVNGIPVIQTGYNGRNVGNINLTFDVKNKLIASDVKLDKVTTRAKDIVPDKEITSMVDKYSEQVKPLLNEVVGYSDLALDHDRRNPGTSVLGYWTSKVMAKATGVQIGITNGGGLRTSIAKGEITMSNLYDVMPFDNTLVKMNITGKQLKKLVENGINNEKYGWVQVAGVKVYYDEKAPFGSRITKMLLDDGTVVKEDGVYSIVTNDFMSGGGDEFDFKSGVSDMVNTQVPIRDVLAKELKETTSKDKALNFKFEQPLIAGEYKEDVKPVDPTNPVDPGKPVNPTKPENKEQAKVESKLEN
ncbi:2',3'-cyclic-nucleotide 2'-phosphodiesterase/5'-or 3'-nucleotidase, 5'-nucleotidase family, partial [Clostridium cavendishii DSM 21758]